MLTKEREDRYSAADVLEHPWVSVSLITTRDVTYARMVSSLLFSLVQPPPLLQRTGINLDNKAIAGGKYCRFFDLLSRVNSIWVKATNKLCPRKSHSKPPPVGQLGASFALSFCSTHFLTNAERLTS